ncbi:glutamine synthetase [Mycobacterium sp. CBMA247]|nr:glutamine synthetase [Mycolicibacterium sp. CBMA 329]MUL91329.1 glutamine synthetase [Mycolicibacterium sp. CBMA 331]MUM01452.1 glutamine synthetase [Mycolicibacterium sp. CBMA 334]MUM29647.1 glutamine synthetase [Mycolicibacterium sp. CBMA 295]MUM41753.1 glutamine synthetase [Mycolicibacterium sp. CBMA 247]MUM47284.1 glutamine synthetase [Mycolicibacterium sp. CBMA 294]
MSGMNSTRLITELRDRQISTVILGGCDTHGVMRGKRIPVAQLAEFLDHGLPICDVFWVLHVDESDLVTRPPGHSGYFPTERQGYPDIHAKPDLSTLHIVPWHADTALLLCDWYLPDNVTIVPISPRGVLREVLSRAEAMGYTPLSALELEFYLLREKPGTPHRKRSEELTPLQELTSTYGVVLGSLQEDIGALIRNQMLAYGLPIEACNPETGPGQFEITLHYGPSLKAADDAFLFKSGVKELAAQRELLASFMAKPNTDWAGNSCHVHISLQDLDGRGVFFDPAAPEQLSQTMRYFAGGILSTMREFSALMAPTPNSYRRYVPYSWAGTTATWGIDNRSVGLRAIRAGEHGTRLEHRQPGGDANPYVATAATLAGGLHGIKHAIEPSELVSGDVYSLPDDQVVALPHSLGEAVDLLEASGAAREWFGDDFVDHFVALKRAELQAQSKAVTDWEVARYLETM